MRCSRPNDSAPAAREQKAIEAVDPWALDDKIELNRRMNATLEAMARALFQSWFVDFDPSAPNSTAARPPASTPPPPPSSQRVGRLGSVTFPRDGSTCLDEIANYLNGLALQKFPPGDVPHSRSSRWLNSAKATPSAPTAAALIFRPNTSSMTATCFSLGLAASKLSFGAAAPVSEPAPFQSHVLRVPQMVLLPLAALPPQRVPPHRRRKSTTMATSTRPP